MTPWSSLGFLLRDSCKWTVILAMSIVVSAVSASAQVADAWMIVAGRDNDAVRVLRDSGARIQRFDTVGEALQQTAPGGGLLVLAEGYPQKTTPLTSAFYDEVRRKNIRLFVEYPSWVPQLTLGAPQTLRTGEWANVLERTVVASDAFGDALKRMRILMVHDCHYLPVAVEHPHLVVAQVAGYDEALYGLPKQNVHPILFEHPAGGIWVATTQLSRFVTGRYAPLDAWEPVWQRILKWTRPSAEVPPLKWKPVVEPTFARDEKLPRDVERQALRRGAEWFKKSRLLLHSSQQARYDLPCNDGKPTRDWPDGHRTGRGPAPGSPIGDGSLGLLEGFGSKVYFDGEQTVRWWRRADNHGESAAALVLAGKALRNREYTRIGYNLAEWLMTRSVLYHGVFANPSHPAFGLCGWNDIPRYYPGYGDGYDQIWADDNARAWLGVLGASSVLGTSRYDERQTQHLLAMLRLTSRKGFVPSHVFMPDLAKSGWEKHFRSELENRSPHFAAYVQACLLWGARATGSALMRERAIEGVTRMMEAYPGGWSATNDQYNQERARMLLPLAWLVRIDDTPKHREWLRRVAVDLVGDMDASGAILTKISHGPQDNDAYGRSETTLIQKNGDPNTDLFYTANFALSGLHEAAAATGESLFGEAEDKLTRFFCRVQVKSERQPQFDGGWFRGFDYRRWEYWGSDADVGWSVYAMETGWIQGEVVSVLALRQLKTSLWDVTSKNGIPAHFNLWRERMIPDSALK